jgi:hypothetical protein
MTEIISQHTRHKAPRARVSSAHKFSLGAHVLHRVGARSQSVWFRVTRLLPDGGEGLQYRIKDDRDGQERVVTESSLERGV